MPNRLPYLFCMVLLAAAPATANGQVSASDSVAVSQAHDRWFRGLIAHDTTTLSPVLAEDVTLGFPAGNVPTSAHRSNAT